MRNNNYRCVYHKENKGIECFEHERNCENCGWNPEIHAKRVKEWKIKNKEKTK